MSRSAVLYTILFLCAVKISVYGYSSGAPPSACVTQKPIHTGIIEQTSPAPYSIRVSETTYKANKPLTVTISGTYQGFILQARKSSGETTPIGTFSGPPTDTKIIQCTAKEDTWTHSNKNVKTDTSVMWHPPSGDMGDIVLIATVAEEKSIYWTNIKSDVLKADKGNTGTRMSISSGVILAVSSILLAIN